MMKDKIKKYVLVFTILLCIDCVLSAQQVDTTINTSTSDSIKYSNLTKEDIQNLTMEDLLKIPFEYLIQLSTKLGITVDEMLNMKITVSSKNALTPRESPGIISVVTDEEIKKSGIGIWWMFYV